MSLEVYIDGKYYPKEQARVSVYDHGLLYGDGVFEGIRAYWNKSREQLFLLQPKAHFDRLGRSGSILMMKLPHSTEELEHAVQDGPR